jgi:hypothetical protein
MDNHPSLETRVRSPRDARDVDRGASARARVAIARMSSRRSRREVARNRVATATRGDETASVRR